jgi:hypothetical protein
MKDLIRKIQIHIETTEECIENTSLTQYVVELLEADNELLGEVVNKWQQERSYSKEEVLEQLNILMSLPSSTLDKFTDKNGSITKEWFEQFKKK